ncbi:3-dehydroquinate synthase [Pedobacter steynii]|uniref:3-dehydroquinate synthase n=1 Tax=Pedobacter steynii TaxID=430522 RepID=A0A1G9UTA0_9SPHI|nr:3-dehydroquinate synthase [Pedobacter steynii]NQX40869.1 3-dehydroquinate synthase [Pedobacter steynii]SDM63110.1 3-dehydroquinate synthase [Pedobacter steynii]
MSYLAQSFSVKFDYKIYFTKFLFNIENTTLADFFRERAAEGGQKIYFVIDEGVFIAHPNLIDNIRTYFLVHPTVALLPDFAIVPGGERSKNDLSLFDQLIDATDSYGIDRHSYIAAIGGGAVLDLVGYAAAVAHRGIKHIRIPTTVLSQNDSGIGVKNGINYKGKKNFLGTFAPPAAVFNDEQFLTTLTDRDYRSGISEAIKVALIKDQEFFCWIENHAEALRNRVAEQMNYLIKYCAKLHLAHIGGADPFETGSARPLDFGHWSAHKQEQLSNFGVLHGEAVAMGIALDSTYSFLAGFLTEDKLHRILNVLLQLSFEITDPIMTINDLQSPLLKGLAEFREHLGGRLTITLLTDLGTGKEVHEMSPQLLIKASSYITNFLENSTSLNFNND